MLPYKDISYVGKQYESGFIGVFSHDNFFACIEIPEGIDHEKGVQSLKALGAIVTSHRPESLLHFDELISQEIQKNNLPLDLSIACGYMVSDVLFLKTIGFGEIYIKRGNAIKRIIEEDSTASGHVKAGDSFIFTTKSFLQVIGGETTLKHISIQGSEARLSSLQKHIEHKNTLGIAALWVDYYANTQTVSSSSSSVSTEKPTAAKRFSLPSSISLPHLTTSKKKPVLLIGIVVAILLLVRIGFMIGGKIQGDKKNTIQTERLLIMKKLDEAEQSLYLDPNHAKELISDADNQFKELKKSIGNGYENELQVVQKEMENKKNTLQHKENKTYTEFYDLSVDTKDARGDLMYYDGTFFHILDKNGLVYRLHAKNKSLNVRKKSDLKNASHISGYDGVSYVYKETQGIFQLSDEGSLKKVIPNDSEWGNINDIKIYNNNIYILDSGKDEIYKYLVAESGYSEKQSYFAQGQSRSLKNSTSFAINYSVYLGDVNRVYKYTGGQSEEFNVSYPDGEFQVTKVISHKDDDHVFIWDKTHSAVLILQDNGTYQRQIRSDILSKCSDIEIDKEKIYVLKNSKIYAISID